MGKKKGKSGGGKKEAVDEHEGGEEGAVAAATVDETAPLGAGGAHVSEGDAAPVADAVVGEAEGSGERRQESGAGADHDGAGGEAEGHVGDGNAAEVADENSGADGGGEGKREEGEGDEDDDDVPSAYASTTTSTSTPPTIFPPELPAALTSGLLANVLPTIDTLARHLKELDTTQRALLESMREQNEAFTSNLDLKCITDTIALVPSYTQRLAHVRTEMMALHRKGQNLKKRADTLKAKRIQADAAAQAAREKELAKERRLLARPSAALVQVQIGGGGSGGSGGGGEGKKAGKLKGDKDGEEDGKGS